MSTLKETKQPYKSATPASKWFQSTRAFYKAWELNQPETQFSSLRDSQHGLMTRRERATTCQNKWTTIT